jgi:hypothetical protein
MECVLEHAVVGHHNFLSERLVAAQASIYLDYYVMKCHIDLLAHFRTSNLPVGISGSTYYELHLHFPQGITCSRASYKNKTVVKCGPDQSTRLNLHIPICKRWTIHYRTGVRLEVHVPIVSLILWTFHNFWNVFMYTALQPKKMLRIRSTRMTQR